MYWKKVQSSSSHRHIDNFWSKNIFTNVSLQNLVSACLPTHLLELMINGKDKDENWGRRKKKLDTKSDFATDNNLWDLYIRFDLRAGEKTKEWEGSISQKEEQPAETKVPELRTGFTNSCLAELPRIPTPYSVSHFSHNKGGNRSPGALVSSSKIKAFPLPSILQILTREVFAEGRKHSRWIRIWKP
jgi:hypothetical protein